jgi:hypothetical protein
MSDKFKTADGYSADLTRDCETALVVLLQAFGSLKDTLRLVGGLVPRYLTPARPPDVPPHAGTTDVDVVLNVSLLAAKGTYDKLRTQLKENGFVPYQPAPGKVSSWQWIYEINGHHVRIEFLQNTDDPSQSGRLGTVDGEGVSAVQFLYAGVAHDWFQEHSITTELPGGNGMVTEIVRFADAVAFIVLKTVAFHQRHEHKDVADLLHVMRYCGAIEELASRFAQRMQDGRHGGALREALRLLESHFCDSEGIEGWRKDGPAKFANFHQISKPGDDAFVRAQRDVSGMVDYFVRMVRANALPEVKPDSN